MTYKQPTALLLADQLYVRARNEASRRNSAYDVFGMDNTPENTHPLETAAATELRRLHAQAAQDEALLRQVLEALEALKAENEMLREALKDAEVKQGEVK